MLIRHGFAYKNCQSNEFLKLQPTGSYSKCKGAQNSYGGFPTEFAGSTQNPKKNIGTSNQPINTKNFPKKVFLVP
jgi:hypothetical protein